MKKVFNGSGVAHAWAAAINSTANTQDGRNSSKSFWFNNRVLYSYNTPIAVLLPGVNGEPVALITSDSYSSTTSGHRSDAFAAVRHLESFSVPYLAGVASGGKYHAPPASYTTEQRVACLALAHARNKTYLLGEYNKRVGSMIRMRGTLHWDSQLNVENVLADSLSSLRSYCKVFALSMPVIDIAADAALIWAAHLKREARYADPPYGEKLRIARDKREAAKERKAERDRLAALGRTAHLRDMFRRGDHTNGLRVDSEHGGAMLRLSSDGQSIETSWGIRDFDLRTARVFIALYLEDAAACSTATVGQPLGAFVVHSVTPECVQIGCHDFYREEIEAFAKLLG